MGSGLVTKAQYAAAREDLLERIQRGLEADPRFVAAWLLGSYGRGEQDAFSDLDLAAVVEDSAAQELCARPRMTTSDAPPARLALFRAFGELANIHENHHNAQEGASFSAVLYKYPPVMVDWGLVPRGIARRPAPTRLLFDKAGIPLLPSEPVPDAAADASRLAERIAFFWMMAAVTAKYIVRQRPARVQELLSFVLGITKEIERLNGREPSGEVERLYITREEQTARLRVFCEQVSAASSPSAGPREQIETILSLQ